MSDISMPHCSTCGRVEYDCSCPYDDGEPNPCRELERECREAEPTVAGEIVTGMEQFAKDLETDDLTKYRISRAKRYVGGRFETTNDP